MEDSLISRDSSVNLVLGYGLDNLGTTPGTYRDLTLHYHIQTDTGVHLALYPMNTRGTFPRSRGAIA